MENKIKALFSVLFVTMTKNMDHKLLKSFILHLHISFRVFIMTTTDQPTRQAFHVSVRTKQTNSCNHARPGLQRSPSLCHKAGGRALRCLSPGVNYLVHWKGKTGSYYWNKVRTNWEPHIPPLGLCFSEGFFSI